MIALQLSQPTAIGASLARAGLSIIRIITAMYFLATAVAMMLAPEGKTVIGAALLQENASFVTAGLLAMASAALIANQALRITALLLTGYAGLTAFEAFTRAGSAEMLTPFWAQMALIGALLMIALTGSKAPRSNSAPDTILGSAPISPRRVTPSRNARVMSGAQISQRPARTAEALSREMMMRRDVTPASDAMDEDDILHDLLEDDSDDQHDDANYDGNNIFADIWARKRADKAAA